MCRCDSGCCGEAKLEAFGTTTYGAKRINVEELVTAQADPETPNEAIERIRAELARRRAAKAEEYE